MLSHVAVSLSKFSVSLDTHYSVDDLVIKDQTNGPNEQQADTPHDQLVCHDSSRHAGKHSPGFGYVVVSAVQGISSMRDCFSLPMQILQDTHPQLLNDITNRTSAMLSCNEMHHKQVPSTKTTKTTFFSRFGWTCQGSGLQHAQWLVRG